MRRRVGSSYGRIGASVSLLGASLVLGWGCSEAIHIQPPAPGADTPTGDGGSGAQGGYTPNGGGGAAPVACRSNSDCPAPTSVCDTTKGLCVECLVLSDCAHHPGTVCSTGSCVCPEATDSWCAPASCVDLQSSPESCGTCGHACFGACSGGVCVDAWEPTATEGAPQPRAQHVAVWTGTEMIVWGGSHSDCDACTLNSGGVYNHTDYLWRPTSLVNAPSPRRSAAGVWAGTVMLVWGGYHDGSAVGTGGRFNPTTNTWSPITTSLAPSARYGHSAVWTGTEMIVWGGANSSGRLSDGARYNPQTDQWVSIAALSSARQDHSAVWLGDAMLVYGGQGDDGVDPDAYLPTASAVGGWSYDRTSNAWSPLLTQGQPSSRALHAAAAIGDQMVVWGGYNGTTGTYLSTGARFDSLGWLPTLSPEPAARRYHTAVVLDDPSLVIVWGGQGESNDLDSGGAYDPVTNSWSPLPTALSARRHHAAVSTGTGMIVWGGISGSTRLSDGGFYTP